MTAVVTDVRYRMSLALIRDLAEAGVRIVAVERDDSGAPPLGFYSKHTSKTAMLDGADYESALYELCEKIYNEEGSRPALMPMGASTLAVIAGEEARTRFAKVCGLCIPTAEQLDLFNSKREVAALAESLDIPVPRAYAVEQKDEVSYPCVVKPICGEKQGITAADRYVIAKNPDELQSAYDNFLRLTGGAPLIQEYLTGGGAGCSVLAKDGEIVASLCHLRIREYPISGGPSACCMAVHNAKMEEAAAKMVKAVGYSGLAMVEFKGGADGEWRLLEINPRVWGSFPMTRVAKSGHSLLWFKEAWNSANPDTPFNPDKIPPYRQCKMHFGPSDAMAALKYLKAGKGGRFFGAVVDFINPAVKDGLFEWGDMKPAIEYYKSLLKK